MSQPPRKAPSQPNSATKPPQGQPKKARPSRSNSRNKAPSISSDEGYAMGSYDNEPGAEPVSTPSWMRRTPAEDANDHSPTSPLAPAVAPSPSSNVPQSKSEMLAPIPFHLTPYGTMSNNPGMAPFAPNIGPAPLPLVPGVGVPLAAAPGAFGVNLMAPGFAQAGYMPPSSAPPSLAPTATPTQHQDAIARILALQHANSSMSQTTTPVSTYTPLVPGPVHTTDFARNLPGSAGPSAPTFAPAPPHHAPHVVSTPIFPTTPIGNPFASAPATNLMPNNGPSTHQLPTATPAHYAQSGGPVHSSSNNSNNGTAISLDHLLPMQQAAQNTRQSMEQFRPAIQQQPQQGHRIALPNDSLWQLQQPIATGSGKPVQLTVSSDGTLKVANQPPQSSGADFLFEPPANRHNLKTSGKSIPAPRTSPIHAHHNYGVPAQP